MAILPSRGGCDVGMGSPSGNSAWAQAAAAAIIRMDHGAKANVPHLEEKVAAAEARHVVHDDLEVGDAVAVDVALDAGIAALDLIAQLPGDVAEGAGADEGEG